MAQRHRGNRRLTKAAILMTLATSASSAVEFDSAPRWWQLVLLAVGSFLAGVVMLGPEANGQQKKIRCRSLNSPVRPGWSSFCPSVSPTDGNRMLTT